MDKNEFVKKLSNYDGLDRQEPIETVADEDGNVFVFSQNKYGCPVIDVLSEGKDKETLYVSTQKGKATEYRPTGRRLEEKDPREAAIYGRYYDETVSVKVDVDDVLNLKIVRGADMVIDDYVLQAAYSTSRKSVREKTGMLLYPGDLPDFCAAKVNLQLLTKAVKAYNKPKEFAAEVELVKAQRLNQKKETQQRQTMQELQTEFMRSARGETGK